MGYCERSQLVNNMFSIIDAHYLTINPNFDKNNFKVFFVLSSEMLNASIKW